MLLKYENAFGVGDPIRVYDFPNVADFYIEGTIIGIKRDIVPKSFVVHCTKDSKPGSLLVASKILVPMEHEDELAFGFDRIQFKPEDKSFDPSKDIMDYLEKVGKDQKKDLDSFLKILTILFLHSKKTHMKIGIDELAANKLAMKEVESFVEIEDGGV